jgi:secreted PhoX family phosphatase
VDRRRFLQLGAAVALGPVFWERTFGAAATGSIVAGAGPYGPLQPADANGIMLPSGFTSRVVARSLETVPGTDYVWHQFPDGAATFAEPGGGWTYASNSEVALAGGAGSITFSADGDVVGARRVLTGTSQNCSGGRTPWGTWLSCEEHARGRVWECDPLGVQPAVERPALGTFAHEAVAVDPVAGMLYLTEDEPDGRFYRFVPDGYPAIDAGVLQVAVVAETGRVGWLDVPDPTATTGGPTRYQVPESTPFDGGEGIWFDSGHVYFTTKGDDHVWDYRTGRRQLRVLYDGDAHPDAPLHGVDNLTVTPGGDIYVCEDGDNMEVCLITPQRRVAPFLRVLGQDQSELTGIAFSPAGTRLYVSSQRWEARGITYEIAGPFRQPAASGRSRVA